MLRTALRTTSLLHSVTKPAVFSATKRYTSTMSDKVIHAHTGAELDAAKAKSGLVVVDYSAEWCGPCKMIAPKFSAFSNTYTNATFVHVDVDNVNDHPDVATVNGVPHFRFFKDGKLITEFSGANVQQLEKSITANI